jgi:ABC-type Co2+ transport system permease subunit
MASQAPAHLWAVHLPDGLLTWPWLLGGFVGLAVLAGGAVVIDWFRRVVRGRDVREEEIAQVGVLTAAFFVASQIHVPLGPTSVHLLLNGLLGVMLRWRAALAIPVGLLLQAALFGHGGFTTLGVNSCVLTLPALAAWLLFDGLHRLPWYRQRWFRAALVAASAAAWLLSVVYSVTLLCTNLASSALDLDPSWANAVTFHPASLAAVGLLAALAGWQEPRLEAGPEFPLGLLVGVVTVLLTMALVCPVLAFGGAEDWGSLVLLTFVAHLPVAAIEGLVLGFTVGFLARVKPELLGIGGSEQWAVGSKDAPLPTAHCPLPTRGTPHQVAPPTVPDQR